MKNNFFGLFKDIRSISEIQKLQFSKKHVNDLIGPRDPISNLKPIKFAIRENESEVEKLLRTRKQELQQWNHEFWTKHNTSFMKEKEEYIQNELKKKNVADGVLTADEMSIFYKHFLDKNWKNHFNYSINWHKKNFQITFSDVCVGVKRVFNKFR